MWNPFFDGFRKKAMFNNLSLPCRPWKLYFLIYSLISRSLLWLWNLCFYVFLKKTWAAKMWIKTVNAWNLQQKTQIGLIEVLNNRYQGRSQDFFRGTHNSPNHFAPQPPPPPPPKKRPPPQKKRPWFKIWLRSKPRVFSAYEMTLAAYEILCRVFGCIDWCTSIFYHIACGQEGGRGGGSVHRLLSC